MSLHREHKKSQLPWLDLAVFAGVLAFLGYSLHAFLGARVAVRSALPKADTAEAALSPLSRRPASQAAPSSGSTEVLRLPCLHDGPRVFSSNARLMQIHSPLCADDGQAPAPWHASNESSGEEILVFVNRKEKSLSTSYFNLKEGLNDLIFVQDLGKGRKRQEKLQVIRKID